MILFHLGDGDVIGFAKDPVKKSVVCWYHTKDGVRDDDVCYYDEQRWEKANINDEVYGDAEIARKLLGKKVLSIKMLQSTKTIWCREPDANEQAVILTTDAGSVALSTQPLTAARTGAVVLCHESDLCPTKIEKCIPVTLDLGW